MGDLSFDGLPPLREVIAAHQISAKKSLGQNFLMDFNITRKIARMAGDIQNHPIVEIGPGPGALTRGLLGEGAKSVLAIERDERLIPILDQIKARYPDRFEYIIGDAMQVDLSQHLEGRYKIVANLPYNVGTELLIRWLTPKEWPPAWDSLTLMFQKEVANRITAQSGSKAYGRLSLLAQWRAQAGIAMDLPAAAFTPPPKVNSAIVHLKALEAPRFEAEPKILERVVAAAFSQRRKMMRASLKSLGLPNLAEVLEAADIDPTARGETLSLEDFCRLARTVQGNR